MLKLICRLARFLKFLLSFPTRLRTLFSKCNAFVSLWRYILDARRQTTFSSLSSSPHILPLNEPTRPTSAGHLVIHTGSLVPSEVDHSTQATSLNEVTPLAPQVAESLDAGPPLPAGNDSGTPDPAVSQEPIQPCVIRSPHYQKFENPVWQVWPGVADGKTRYTPSTNNGEFANLPIVAGNQGLTEAPPTDWEQLDHPEGNALFCYKKLQMHVFTDTYITGQDELAGRFVALANILIDEAVKVTDTETELVLNVTRRRGKHWKCYYYFVDHRNRRLFWLANVEVSELFGKRFKGVVHRSQIRYLLEEHYCCHFMSPVSRLHCQYYPHDRPLSEVAFDELRGMLSYAKAEITTSDASLSPFTTEELTSLLDIVKPSSDDTKTPEYNACIIARLMSLFAHNKFVNFHGQKCARLDADTYVFGEDRWEDHIIFKIANIFLFWSLKEHALRLRRVWANHIIIQPRWKDFVTRVTDELSRYTIFSTVILTANLAFLAVPGLTAQPQVIIYGSALTTISSIVLSFVLLNVYANPKFVDPTTAATIMFRISHKVGIPYLAITHSLPMALLIWSIVLFFIALAYYIFAQVHLVTRIIFSVAYFIIIAFGTLSCMILLFFARGA